jgi:hypothetical protein
MKSLSLVSQIWSALSQGHSSEIPVVFEAEDGLVIPINCKPEVKIIQGAKLMVLSGSEDTFDLWKEGVEQDSYTDGYKTGLSDAREKQDEVKIKTK